jgi:hypothetical protein
MSYASVRGAAQQAAKQGHLTPHQLAALTALDESLTEAQKSGFTELWRAQGSPAAAIPQEDVENSWAGIAAAAKDAGAVYPELVAAQWALESGWGKKLSGKFNYFGLKGTPGSAVETREVVNGKEITVLAVFKDFKSRRECITYLVDRWYKDFENYKGVNHCATREAAARALREQGYATDPSYSEKLIELMDTHAPRKPQITSPPKVYGNPLSVRWLSQLDSQTTEGRRMCFTTSCAMLLMYLKPGTISGPNADDQLLARVNQFGDTTQPHAQIKALASYGLKASFVTNGTFELVQKQIDAGIPVPCGYLHRGHVDNPLGGGHWLCVVGYTDSHLVVHDPFGEADLINGTTVSSVARYAKYSKKNFGKRWMVDGFGTGWAIIAER